MIIVIIFILFLSLVYALLHSSIKLEKPIIKTNVETEGDLKLNELLRNTQRHNQLLQISLDNIDYLNEGLFLMNSLLEKKD